MRKVLPSRRANMAAAEVDDLNTYGLTKAALSTKAQPGSGTPRRPTTGQNLASDETKCWKYMLW